MEPGRVDKPFESYYGGKEFEGGAQNIINEIPPHDVFVELFAGNITITRYIFQAKFTILNDIDPDVIAAIKRTFIGAKPSVLLWNNHFEKALEHIRRWISDYPTLRFFIYADPPYPIESRSTPLPKYTFEMTDNEHRRLLHQLKTLPVPVAISTYRNKIYEKALNDWRLRTFQAKTRRGVATEYLYMNYPQPEILHDWRYLGEDCTDRQRIKRKSVRFIEKLAGLPVQERNKILSDLNLHFNGAGEDSSDFTGLGNILIDHR